MKNNKITVDLKELIDFNIEIIQSNGKPALSIRKVVGICDKNMNQVREILEKTLYSEESEIILPARLQIVNKPLAKGKLIQAGIIKP